MFKVQPVPPPFPMERAAYRQTLVKMLQWQLCLVLAGVAGFHAIDLWGSLDAKIVFLLLVLAVEIKFLIRLDRQVNVEGRLMDCFPGYQASAWWVRFACLVPVVNVGLLTFLWFRPAGPTGVAPPWALRHQRAVACAIFALPMIPVFGFFYMETATLGQWSRWVQPLISQPTVAHIAEVASEAGLVLRARNVAKQAGTYDSAKRAVETFGWQGPTITGMVLLTVASVNDASSYRTALKRLPAYDANEAGFVFLRDLQHLGEVSDAARAVPFSYHPFHLISPAAVVEIALGSLLNSVIEAKYAATFVKASEEAVNELRAQLGANPAGLAQLEGLHQRLRAGKLYRRNAQSQGSLAMQWL